MAAFTDLCDVHDFDGRQLSRFDMSTLERESEERERLTEDVETVAGRTPLFSCSF